MAYREVHRVESKEIIRRWQAGFSQRRIASGTGLSRVTVRRYIAAAEAAGLQPGGPEPSEQQLAQLATLNGHQGSHLRPHRRPSMRPRPCSRGDGADKAGPIVTFILQ